jgi:hypothetical protein
MFEEINFESKKNKKIVYLPGFSLSLSGECGCVFESIPLHFLDGVVSGVTVVKGDALLRIDAMASA